MIVDNSRYIPKRGLNPKKHIQLVVANKEEFCKVATEIVTHIHEGIEDGKFPKNTLIFVLGTVKGLDLFRVIVVEGNENETLKEAGERFCIYPFVTKEKEDLYDLALQGISFIGDLKNVVSITPNLFGG